MALPWGLGHLGWGSGSACGLRSHWFKPLSKWVLHLHCLWVRLAPKLTGSFLPFPLFFHHPHHLSSPTTSPLVHAHHRCCWHMAGLSTVYPTHLPSVIQTSQHPAPKQLKFTIQTPQPSHMWLSPTAWWWRLPRSLLLQPGVAKAGPRLCWVHFLLAALPQTSSQETHLTLYEASW